MSEDQQSKAIALSLSVLAGQGDEHGPVIRAEPIGSREGRFWKIELAYEGQVGRCETSDPPSTVLLVNPRPVPCGS